jgi:predicted DNA-binding mobile mystery protein A
MQYLHCIFKNFYNLYIVSITNMNKKLQIKQVDEQLKKLKVSIPDIPSRGWIHTIRTTLSMSSAQLGEKLGISQQAAITLEQREADMTITLGKLKEAGSAMGLNLVYGFVPESSLEEMVERRAKELATEIVMSTSKQMAMEDQKVTDKRLKEAINERTEEIIRTMPKILWD